MQFIIPNSFAAAATRLNKTLTGDRVLKATEFQVNFQGRADVLEVDGKQQPFKIAFTVERFTKIEGGVTIDLLKSGSVIIADGSQQQPISVKDSTTEESVRDAFELIYFPDQPDAFTDDEIFGTKEAKGIGDSWSINPALLSASLKGMITVPEGHLSGMVSLVAKDKIANIDCLSLRKELKADDLTSKDLRPGVTLDRALSADHSGLLPYRGFKALLQRRGRRDHADTPYFERRRQDRYHKNRETGRGLGGRGRLMYSIARLR